jgi:hypothetical protein
MVEKKQFSLKWFFVEVTLVALICGVIRWAYSRGLSDRAQIEFAFFSGPALFGLIGAVIGGFFNRFESGALIGALVYVILWALIIALVALMIAVSVLW